VSQTVVSHYRLLHLLGEGGMGVVHRAEDTRLSREVAIKFLRAHDVPQGSFLARFEREARLASALTHPNICTIHELGEHEGRPFIVMELLEGRTVKQLLEAGPLAPERVLAFGVQIARALDAAHSRGIIHRDIKPANLFVDHNDHLKVLDFGLAKLAPSPAASVVAAATQTAVHAPRAADVTATGAAVGTAAYMSPEQATGGRLDARTDLFSFGTVLYEMATGRRAFPGENTGVVLTRLLKGQFIPPRSLNPTIPEALERIILRAMEVDSNRRYQSAAGMLEDLRAARGALGDASADTAALPAAAAQPRVSARTRRWAGAGVGIAAGAGLALWIWAAQRPAALTNRDSVLIGAIANSTGDPVFDETLETALKVQLAQSPFLDLVPDARIAETLRLMGRPEDTRLEHDVARQVCSRLSQKAMIDGTIAPLGSTYVLTLAATECETGASIAREQAAAESKEEVLRVLGGLTSSLRTTLGESLPSIKAFDVPIEQATTPSLPALKNYTLGLAERRKGRELESIAFFNRAIELDPEFAAAYTTLSTVYGSIGEWQRSEDQARLAFARRQRVSERERLFIVYQYHDRVTGDEDQAIATLEMWKSSYPRDARPVNALALIYNRVGRFEDAVREAQEALRRSPGNSFPMSNLAFAYRGLGRYDEARRVAQEAIGLGVATTPTRRLLFQLDTMEGRPSAADQVEWSRSQPREFDIVSAQAQIAAFGGRLEEATRLYLQAADMATARSLSGTASGFLAHLAMTEALYGGGPRTSERVRALVSRTANAADSPGAVPRFRAAVALGLVGFGDEAADILARARARYPESTLVRTVFVPATSAAISLGRNRPGAALASLADAASTEFGTVAGLIPTLMRGDAYMALGNPDGARADYERVLAHRGSDPFSLAIPLAHLGLGRALALTGDPGRSRAEYDELFRVWKDADPDLPLVQRARAEAARLAAASEAGPSPAR
jgi:tetratricopeptide (TPR) repeat protein/tRNA A-37 threonylcarbamoyl transferase component Bud32